ncbi:MAG: homoserine O-succinyltransferase, partial [Methylococcales bacterium]|nr:homoserine O-succinyltransferase [Methylococcales bacterium]
NQQRYDYPPYPKNFFFKKAVEILDAYRAVVVLAKQQQQALPIFPEQKILPYIDNTWRDTAKAIFNNWLGQVYQITNQDRRLPFMEGINKNDPLGLSALSKK